MGNELLQIQPKDSKHKPKKRYFIAQAPDGSYVVKESVSKYHNYAVITKERNSWGCLNYVFTTRLSLAHRYSSGGFLWGMECVIAETKEVSAKQARQLRKIQKEIEKTTREARQLRKIQKIIEKTTKEKSK